MKKIKTPLDQAIKDEIVKMVYYRWDHNQIVTKIMEKNGFEPEEKGKLSEIVEKIEKEVTDFRYRVGRIDP